MPPEIQRLVGDFLHNPVHVEVSRPATTAVTVSQSLVASGGEPHEKRETLRRLLRTTQGFKNAIVFCNRKRDVAMLHRSLVRHGFNAVALHGDMDQPARMAALDAFRSGEVNLLIASDVAARGLDIPEVSHVINFDVPYDPHDYVHRIGRTGRAGRSGAAITIVTEADRKAIAAIEKLTGQSIPWSEPLAPRVDGARPHRALHTENRERMGKRPARPTARSGRKADRREAPVAKLNAVRQRRRESDPAEADGTHLPAFLLRPVRA
jgi:superfamily II DNA/RNA helicase